MKRWLVVIAGIWMAGCTAAPVATDQVKAVARPERFMDGSKLVDMSYTYDASTIYWPTEEGFRHKKLGWSKAEGFWLAMGEFSSAEHGGTHMDSPIHFGEGKMTLDQIPLAKLMAPVEVVDVSAAAAKDADYRVTAGDVTRWEQAHGAIPAGTIVVIRTGWGARWPDKTKYMGSDVKGDAAHLHFPGLGRDAAELLVQRRVNGVGIDTASLDYGPSMDFAAHRVLMGANIFGIENVANADRLPETGAALMALPMKIGEGTGGPVRVVGVLP